MEVNLKKSLETTEDFVAIKRTRFVETISSYPSIGSFGSGEEPLMPSLEKMHSNNNGNNNGVNSGIGVSFANRLGSKLAGSGSDDAMPATYSKPIATSATATTSSEPTVLVAAAAAVIATSNTAAPITLVTTGATGNRNLSAGSEVEEEEELAYRPHRRHHQQQQSKDTDSDEDKVSDVADEDSLSRNELEIVGESISPLADDELSASTATINTSTTSVPNSPPSPGFFLTNENGFETFGSEVVNQEFSMLGDILNESANLQEATCNFPENYNLDLSGESPTPMLLSTVDLHPETIYDHVVEPFSYDSGYHKLFHFFKNRMENSDVLRICRAIISFRPAFMAVIKNLTKADLTFAEKCFQRTILEFSKILGYIGTPTCVWRRTGEIALVGKEFSLLTQWPAEQLLSKSTFIFELMDNESIVEYWEQFSSICLDNSQLNFMARCTLIRPDGKFVPCCVCYTIKRDIFDVPLCIVGNFLPVFNQVPTYDSSSFATTIEAAPSSSTTL